MTLWDWRPLDVQYSEWRASEDGRATASAVRSAALRLLARGFTHYGIAALWEAARYTRALDVGPDGQGFKLNNNWTSRMARELMAAEPALAGFFELRELRS